MADDLNARVAHTLVAAYKSGHRAPVDADARALSREGAVAVQGLVAKGNGDHPTGWKVAVIEGTPAYAPMMDSVIKPSGAQFKIPEEGFLVEIEVAARLSHDLTPRPGKPYTREEVTAAISEWVVGIELIGSRFQKSPGEAPVSGMAGRQHGQCRLYHRPVGCGSACRRSADPARALVAGWRAKA